MKKMIKQFIFVTTFYIPRNTNIKTFKIYFINYYSNSTG